MFLGCFRVYYVVELGCLFREITVKFRGILGIFERNFELESELF